MRNQIQIMMLVLLAACADSEPARTTLSALSASQTDFNGRQVMVSGTLRTFDSPRHYWIENEVLNRVALITETDLNPLVGQNVTVRGTFLYDTGAGRRIEVEEFINTAD